MLTTFATHPTRHHLLLTFLSFTTSSATRSTTSTSDTLLETLSPSGGLKLSVISHPTLVNDLLLQQDPTGLAARALGKVSAMGLMGASGMKGTVSNLHPIKNHARAPDDDENEGTFHLCVTCTGPFKSITTISTSNHTFRGFIEDPSVDTTPAPFRIPISLAEGIGVTKSTLSTCKRPTKYSKDYIGVTDLKNGDLDQGFREYYANSEQRKVILQTGCVVKPVRGFGGVSICTAAGGYFLERLPECDEREWSHVAGNLKGLIDKYVSKTAGELEKESGESDEVFEAGVGEKGGLNLIEALLCKEKFSAREVSQMMFEGLGELSGDGKSAETLSDAVPKLKCTCSKERVLRSVFLMGREAVDEILESGTPVVAYCQFCQQKTVVSIEEVEDDMELRALLEADEKKKRKPRGRVPKGKVWHAGRGEWVDT